MILTFVLMVFLLRRRVAVGYSILAGCAFLAISGRMPFERVRAAVVESAVDFRTLNLLALVILITFMGEVLRHVENLARLVQSVLGLVRSRKIAMAALPSIIGLLPMPGGAMLSAPMVREVADGTNADGNRRTVINHWFRHMWEYTCPLYPGIVLVASMMDKSVIWFILYNVPMSLAVMLSGALLCFRGLSDDGPAPDGERGVLPLLGAVWPVGVVIVCTGMPMILQSAGVAVPGWASQASRIKWPMLGAIIAVSAILYARHRINWKTTKSMMRHALRPDFIALVYGVMLLKALLQSGAGAGMAGDVQNFLDWAGVPELLVIFILPFSIGLLTGMTVAFIGISFAVLVPYLQVPEVDHIRVMFAFASGFTGVMVSPVHLCLVLTLDYFKAHRGEVYKKLIPLSALTMALAAVIALIHELY